ncbi:hypothetical protein QZM82_13255 [Burkholderia cepacia]|uniref:hypothetical protein n=1 Tax=Burkholderia cepacia TaxID=292 RepID=UPI002651D13C|nr:hypothetical protein [Burkholderia cepacia]MDN7897158.1 hypothetical protein [Burkholderia cepacia]
MTSALTDRLISAIEGECDGLAITGEQASNILAYLQYGAAMGDFDNAYRIIDHAIGRTEDDEQAVPGGDLRIVTLRLDMAKTVRAALLAPTQQPSGEVTGWQPIETAPKETELLGWREDCGVLLIMYTSADRWATDAECEEMGEEVLFKKDWFGTALPGFLDRLEVEQVPTHWMPLPTGPADAARAQGGES